MPSDRIALLGAPGSPYTRKMLSVLRYKRIPYRYLIGTHRAPMGLPAAKVSLLPTFYLPNAKGEIEAVVDSTPLIRRFEREYPERAILPADPVLAFLDYLLEDYGDEWLTKAMFHYRWYYKADEKRAGDILPRWTATTRPEAEIKELSKTIAERQVNRLYVVGSNDITAPVIEASYVRFLDIFSRHLETYSFFLGNRPAASDFAAFGQLTQLTHFDPTPMAVTLEKAPRVFAWVDVTEDLSGLEPREEDWIRPGAIPATIKEMLCEIGRVYVPALLANAEALNKGADLVETEIDGQKWIQQPFPYQGKCLVWIREQYAQLAAKPRAMVDEILAATQCERLFS